MINGFERETHDLTDDELKLVPVIVAGLRTKIGKERAVTNEYIVKTLKPKGYKVSPERIRKIINYIRIKKLIVNLLASSKGYWVSNSRQEIENYKISLEQRIEAIQAIRDSFNTN